MQDFITKTYHKLALNPKPAPCINVFYTLLRLITLPVNHAQYRNDVPHYKTAAPELYTY